MITWLRRPSATWTNSISVATISSSASTRRSCAQRQRWGRAMAETVGWLADKISIIELKIFHREEQAARTDKPAEFREQCLARVAVMREQRDDLSTEMAVLF